MNWTKASALAEIVSSIAIVITLVYLGIQTQQVARQTEQNTAAVISNVRQQSLDTEVSMLFKMIDYADEVPGDRPVAEVRADLIIGIAIRIRETQWLQFQDGLLDERTWNTYMRVMLIQLSVNEAMKTYWVRNSNEGIFTQGFVDEVNRALANFTMPQ